MIGHVIFEATRSPYCHLDEEIMADVLMSIAIPSSEIARWNYYSKIGEEYFFSRIE